MRDKNQVVLPIDLEICIPKEDFIFKAAEIYESLDHSELYATYVRAWRKVNPITMFEILVFDIWSIFIQAEILQKHEKQIYGSCGF